MPLQNEYQQSHYYQGTDANTDYRMKDWNKGQKEWNDVPGVGWTKADVELIENVKLLNVSMPFNVLQSKLNHCYVRH